MTPTSCAQREGGDGAGGRWVRAGRGERGGPCYQTCGPELSARSEASRGLESSTSWVGSGRERCPSGCPEPSPSPDMSDFLRGGLESFSSQEVSEALERCQLAFCPSGRFDEKGRSLTWEHTHLRPASRGASPGFSRPSVGVWDPTDHEVSGLRH